VQLQPGADRAETRRSEIGKLLQVWSGAPRTVIAADLGEGAGNAEMSRLSAVGDLRDGVGLPAPADADRLLGTADLGFDEATVGESTIPGHRPVAATVRVIG
jgi:hypothetical protein